MKVLVLLAGALDPKWPVSAAALRPGAGARPAPRKLSPFDESALECALKLRDARPDTVIHAVLAGSRAEEALARTVAAFRLDGVRNLVVDEALAWDAAALAGVLAGVVADSGAEVVLLGREFGDSDDGMLAPLLAERLDRPFVALAQVIRHGDAGLELLRDRGELVERIRFAPPLVASITNDKTNRLRFPLMKNVVLAKKLAIPGEQPAAAPAPAVVLAGVSDAPPEAAGEACRMLAGTPEEQAAELAALLQGRAA